MSELSRRDLIRAGFAAAAVGASAKFALSSPAYADVVPKTRRRHAQRASNRCAGDPGTGLLYYGCNVDGGNPAAFEKTIGGTLGVYRSYWQASQTSQMLSVAARDQAGNVYIEFGKCVVAHVPRERTRAIRYINV